MVKKITLLPKQDYLSRRNKKNALLKADEQEIHLDNNQLLSDYVDFIGDLTKKWNSLSWWSGSISSKNLWISPLYSSLFNYVSITKMIERSQSEEIDLFIESPVLIEQLKYYCLEKKIILSNPLEKKGILQNKLLPIGRQILRISRKMIYDIYVLFAEWKQEFYARMVINQHLHDRGILKKYNYIIRTWIDERSFNEKGCFQDSYYGPLVDFLQKRKSLIILGGILSNFYPILKKIDYNNRNFPIFVIPTTFFNFPLDSLRANFKQYFSYFRLKRLLMRANSMRFKGLDVKDIVQRELLEDLFRNEYRKNLMSYSNTKNLARRVRCTNYVVPYENHNWEKLAFFAFSKYSPRTFTIGFQHGSIVPREINYFPGKKESSLMPFPKKIITVGSEAKRILEKYGHYPAGILKSGCALRYSYLFNRPIKKIHSNIKKILIAFSIDVDDSVRLLRFIYKSLKSFSGFEVFLKFHPVVPFTEITKFLNFPLPAQFQVIENKKIEDLLQEVDLLIYTQTTVALEAIMVGIPVIYVDISKYYNCDPLFECNPLHWLARNKDTLVKAIEEISNLDEVEFKKQQLDARTYIENYFNSITDEQLQEFLSE